jgi:hypothetical protein
MLINGMVEEAVRENQREIEEKRRGKKTTKDKISITEQTHKNYQNSG